MHGPSSDLDALGLLTWSDHNARGIELASGGAWDDAASAFSVAADTLAAESDVASHEAMALVLSNLAQGCYRAGRIEDAIAHAQRACALRVALVGEDAIVVARARTDLAVMLSSAGRSDEAMSLVSRAISSIERTAGDESLHLQYALENAARLAMASGQPSSAEPYLLRLHALFGAHELPTDRADALLATVSQYRAFTSASLRMLTPAATVETIDSASAETIATEPAAEIEPVVVATILAESPVVQDASPVGESLVPDDVAPVVEDIVVEDILSVATDVTIHEPTAIEMVEAKDAAPVNEVKSFADTLDELTLEEATFETKSPSTGLLGIDFDLVEPTPANNPAVTAPAPVTTTASSFANGLGFEVSYGTVTEDHDTIAESIAPPVSVRVPTPPPAKVVPPPAPSPPQPQLFAANAAKPSAPLPSVQHSTNNAPRAMAPAEENTRERKIRLPRIRFR